MPELDADVRRISEVLAEHRRREDDPAADEYGARCGCMDWIGPPRRPGGGGRLHRYSDYEDHVAAAVVAMLVDDGRLRSADEERAAWQRPLLAAILAVNAERAGLVAGAVDGLTIALAAMQRLYDDAPAATTTVATQPPKGT